MVDLENISTDGTLMRALFGAIVRDVIQDPKILRRLRDAEDESLDEDDVAALLHISTRTLRRLMDEGKWRMVKGPNGRFQMTRRQFREQQDALLQVKRSRR